MEAPGAVELGRLMSSPTRRIARLLPLALVLALPAVAQASIPAPASLPTPSLAVSVFSENPVYLAELPFGEECLTPPCTPLQGTNTRKFTGKERDQETGLDYFGARYYGSKIGRFTTVDPVYTWRENLVDPQRWNRYAYARNNPLRYVDPDGRQTVPQPGTLDQIIAYFYQVVGLNYQPAVVMQEGQRPQTVGMPDKKTIGQAMIVVGAAAVVSDILAGAERGKESKYTAQYRKEGGFEQANRDFEALSPQDVKDRGKGIRTGVLESGDKVVVRPQSSEGSPTLEIQRQNDKAIKVRYPEPKPIEPK